MKILGLTPNEERLFVALDGVPRSLVELKRKTKLPHSTLHGLLERFMYRELALSVSLGGKRFGYIQNFERFSGTGVKKQSPLNDVEILQGKAALLSLIDTLLVGRRGERMLSFHGEGVLPGWLKILSKEEIQKRNELIIASDIIVERFVPEQGYRKFFTILPKDWQRTMFGRAHITYFLPDELFTSKTELILFSDKALLYETDRLRMTIFSHQETVKLFKSFFQVLRSVGKKIDSEQEFSRYINSD